MAATDRKCHNANRGTFNQECGKPAAFIGTTKTGFQSGFCAFCKDHGDERFAIETWEPVQ